jgi:hypothetical protein
MPRDSFPRKGEQRLGRRRDPDVSVIAFASSSEPLDGFIPRRRFHTRAARRSGETFL